MNAARLVEAIPAEGVEVWERDRVLYVLPMLRGNYDAQLSEAIVRRRTTVLQGTCPGCGVTFDIDTYMQTAAPGSAIDIGIVHRAGCLAPRAEQLLRKWQRQQPRKEKNQ